MADTNAGSVPAESGPRQSEPTETLPSALPPRAEQLEEPVADAEQQRLGENTRRVDALGEPDAAPAPETNEAEFAREEGFAGGAEPTPRRDLGEFEDDDTSTATLEESAARPFGVTDAYSDTASRELHADRPVSPSGPAFLPLLGAGLAGAVLALGGAFLLGPSGFLSSQPTPAAGQYATAGELEAVSGELSTLREGVEQLQSAQAAGGTGTSYATASELAELSDRLARAEQSVQANTASNEGAADVRSVAQAAQGTADEARERAEASQAAADEARDLATATSTRVDDVEGRFAAIEEANRQAGVALTAAGLKAAIDRGGPFMTELESFASAAGAEASGVADLRQFAASGVPTEGDLRAEWPEVEVRMRQTFAQSDPDAAIGDQIIRGLSSLVTVRPTGEAAQDAQGPEAALARMTGALEAGDLDGWSRERQALPEAAQAASEEFAGGVEARRSSLRVIDQAIGAAGASTSGTEG